MNFLKIFTSNNDDTLDNDEGVIYNIIETIANASGTFKIYNSFTPIYLVNKSMNYYIRINENDVTIMNNGHSVTKVCSDKLKNKLNTMIANTIIDDRLLIDNIIADNEMTMLEKFNNIDITDKKRALF